MGKHNKVCRKNFWKRRERRLKGRGNQVECSTVSDKVEQTHFGLENDTVNHSDNNNKDQTDHGTQNSIDTSDNDSQEQNYDGLTPVQHEFATDEENEGNYLDLNDPKVIKLFEQPKQGRIHYMCPF